MQTPHARLRHLRIQRGFKTVKAASDFFGWNANSYKSHENGMRPISKKAAAKYAKVYGVTAGWLLFEDNQFRQGGNSSKDLPLAIRRLPRLTWATVRNMTNIKQATLAAKDFYVAAASNNLGSLAFALVIEDESMVNSDVRSDLSFKPGDDILLDPERSPSPGDFVLARISDRNETVFRQYREKGHDKQGRKIVSLHALNIAWGDDIIVSGDTGEIIARLIRHSRDFS